MNFLRLLAAILLTAATPAPAQNTAPDVPKITGSFVNNGSPQRSMIQAIGVRFDRNASAFIKQDALKIRNIDTGAMVDLTNSLVRFDPKNNTASWIIDRNTTALLPDGNFIAWFDTDTLVSTRGRASCAASATPLDDFTFGFHQRSGDSDGDRDVDFKDSCVLRETWQQKLGAPRYLSYLDFNISDLVEETDRRRVAETYFKILPAAPAIHLFLRNDTGENFTDNSTSLYNFAFDSVTAAAATTWRVSLDGRPATDISEQVPGGAAILDEALIDSLNGGPLALGSHTLRVEALSSENVLLASDQVTFDYLGDVPCAPFFITTPPPGVAIGSVRAAQPLSLADWTVENYPGSQGPSQWVIAPDGLSVRQVLNSQPSALISPQSLLNLRITGTFRVDTAGDDDLIGFIFGYQNSKQFYIFDWKQGDQGFAGGIALRGMSIKRFDAGERPFTEPDFWWSDKNRENMAILTPPDGIPWKHFQDYQITLEFTPGKISVEVRQDGVLLRRLEAEDDTFTGGRFGFYNYSQDNVVYSGFTTEQLDNQYFYDSEAEDPDGGTITYSFANSPGDIPPPAAATINVANGTVLWQPTVAGTFPFTIVATDTDGLIDTQSFNVEVTPIDLPPTIVIKKTASSVFPGEEVGIQAIASDDQQVFRTRLFIDDIEVDPNTGQTSVSTTRTFTKTGQVELRAIAIDSADQLSETISYIRVLDPAAPPSDNPNQTPVAPPGQVTGTPTDIRPLVSFQAPLGSNDDPKSFVGTIDANGGTLANWFLEWASAARTVPGNLADPSVLWQVIAEGTTPQTAAELATIVPANFPDELITFRLRAENSTGLGAITAITFNPRSTNNNTTTAPTGTGTGARPTVGFTAPLSPMDDFALLRGTIDANGGTLRNWTLDYAPLNRVNKSNYNDPAVVWTVLRQESAPVTDALLTTIDPATFPSGIFVFRLRAENDNGAGALATLTYNPTATGFTTPGNTTTPTGTNPANAARPIARIDSPRAPTDNQSVVIGSILANGGTLARWIVDYANRSVVNLSDLSDPTVTWTTLAEDTVEKTAESLASLTNPVFDTGVWVIRLRAFNSNGLGSLSSTLLDSGDQSVPNVTFTSPEPNADITYIIPVTGSISSGTGTLASWKLEYAPAENVSLTNLNAPSTAWVQIGSGTTPVNDGNLGTLDPTGFRNGSYVLRLSAFNNNGRGFTDGRLVNVCAEAKLGNFRLEFEDLTIPLAGIPITIRRIYDTLDANRKGDFGFGWTLALCEADIRETVPDTGSDFFDATPFRVGTRVFITTPEGKRVAFTFNVRNPRNRFIATTYEPYFEADPGVYETLTIAPSDFEQVELDPSGEVFQILLPFGYNPDRYRLTTKDGLVYDYDQRRGLQKITDRNSQSVTFSPTAITHSSGTKIDLQRDSQNRITSISPPVGPGISYRYDSNGDLSELVDQVGATTKYTYLSRPAHYLEFVANPNDANRGTYTRRIVYENGRVARIEDASGNTISSQAYEPGQFSGTKTDAEGNVTEYVYDRGGNVVKETTPEGTVTLLEYNDSANPQKETAIVDGNGNRTEFAYDSAGNLVAIVDQAGNLRSLEYDSGEKPTRLEMRDASNILVYTLAAKYDQAGNVTEVTDCSGKIRTAEYDGQGRQIRRTDFDGSVETYAYTSGSTSPSKVTSGDGKTLEFTYDYRGLPLTAKNPEGINLGFIYNAKGQLIRQTDDQGISATYEYDLNGNRSRIIGPDGGITQLEYDSSDRVVKEIKIVTDDGNRSDDLVTLISQDANDRVTSVTDPLGRVTTYLYDGDSRLVSVTDPQGRTTGYSYDGNNNIVGIIDRLNRKRTFDYDYRNQVTAERWFADDAEIPFKTLTTVYDSLGKPVSVTDGTSPVNYEYACSRLTSVNNAGSLLAPEYTLSLGYDDGGRISSITDQSGVSVKRNYDANGDLSSLAWLGDTLPGSGIRLERNSSGNLTAIRRYSDNLFSSLIGSSIYTRDPSDDSLSRIQHLGSSGSPLAPGFEFRYTRNARGLLTSKSALGDTTNYEYDKFDQLSAATHSDSALPRESYAYDEIGNRTSSHLTGTTTIGPAGLPASDATYDYQYDAENNLILRTTRTSGATRRFTYDHRNRLTSIKNANSGGSLTGSSEFVHDPLDRLIGRTVDGVTIYTAYFQENPWSDRNSSGIVLTRYLFDETPDGLMARWTPASGIEWLLADQVRSIVGAMDDTGVIRAIIQYDSYGNTVTGSDYLRELRFGFTGREYLGDGLYDYRSRIYDSGTGRFLSDDPLGVSAGDFNLQRYAFNDPQRLIDPSGRTTVPELGAVNAIGQSVIRISVPISKALLVQAVSGAILNNLFDFVCLLVTGETDRLTVGRVIRQTIIGGGIGATVGGVGLAIGNAASSLSFAFGGSALSSLIGRWISKLAVYADLGVILTRTGVKAALSAPTIGKAAFGKGSCDSFFYKGLGGT